MYSAMSPMHSVDIRAIIQMFVMLSKMIDTDIHMLLTLLHIRVKITAGSMQPPSSVLPLL